MSYATKIKDDSTDLEELDDLQPIVRQFGLVEKLGKQGYQYVIKELFEPVTDTIKNTSEDITKTLTETSIKHNKALENLTEKILESMIDKGMIAPYLASSLVNLFEPENKNQFKLTKDLSSSKMNGFLRLGKKPVTLYSKMLTFRDSNKAFRLDGDLFKTMTN